MEIRRFSDYSDILSEIDDRAEVYSPPHPNSQVARMYLVALSNFRNLKLGIEFEPEYAGNIRDRHKFQLSLTHQAVNSFYNIFTQIRFHHYSAIYREFRYLLESFWIIRGVNRDLDRAATEWRRFRVQARTVAETDFDQPGFSYDYIEYLGSRADSEQDKLYSREPSYREVFNYLNERGAHPLRTEGSRLDRNYNEGEEWQGFWLSSALMIVILGEFELTLADAQLQQEFDEELGLIRDQLRAAVGDRPPSFVEEYLG